MVVIIIIGILAVMAIPALTRATVERQSYDDAIIVAELFREARTRAMGRGAAEMVQMTQVGGSAGGDRGTFLLYEATVVAAPPLGVMPINSPMSTCGNPTVWTGGGMTAVLVDGVNLNGSIEQIDGIWTTLTGPVPAGGVGLVNTAFMCFTPLGRAYWSLGPTPTFTSGSPMIGELQIALQHTYNGIASGIVRTVIVPNSGATRIISH
jgi:type II secretory pathway pseudopilin PulG